MKTAYEQHAATFGRWHAWESNMGSQMKTAYEQHAAAFALVDAFVIVKNGEKIGTVAIKHPRDGAGRLYAYVHILGSEVVRGSTRGYGYDKRSAAVFDAAYKMTASTDEDRRSLVEAIINGDDGRDWADNVRTAGYEVWSAL